MNGGAMMSAHQNTAENAVKATQNYRLPVGLDANDLVIHIAYRLIPKGYFTAPFIHCSVTSDSRFTRCSWFGIRTLGDNP